MSERVGVAAVHWKEEWVEELYLPRENNHYAWHMDDFAFHTGRLPMLKSADEEVVAAFEAAMAIDPYYDGFVLFMNEPTSDRNPTDAVVARVLFIKMCMNYPNVRWIMGNNRGRHIWLEGATWIRKFMVGLPPHLRIRIAGWGMHWYPKDEPVSTGVKFLRRTLHDLRLSVDIWLTEFAHSDPDVAEARMREVLAHPHIARFYWYNEKMSDGTDVRLINKQMNLTPLGERFVKVYGDKDDLG